MMKDQGTLFLLLALLVRQYRKKAPFKVQALVKVVMMYHAFYISDLNTVATCLDVVSTIKCFLHS